MTTGARGFSYYRSLILFLDSDSLNSGHLLTCTHFTGQSVPSIYFPSQIFPMHFCLLYDLLKVGKIWHFLFLRRKYKNCWPHCTGCHGFFSADLKHLESLKRAPASVEKTMKGKTWSVTPSHPCTLTHGLKVELEVSNTPSIIPNTFPQYTKYKVNYKRL